ncbi:Mitomycin radical oxidase [Streptomyces sp. MBT84]|uniref:FAD-binding oxidoreductase n=1 Tax=Streptomyces sp. MBT84 TaxID=1488414 RepID=UPI001D1D80AF|nr:FAD-binding oxidoreductase [Streptomyces sp. MBT84]MBW8707047.1 Mitomycin radical oxidase [Streptomyces sp. MBT84]
MNGEMNESMAELIGARVKPEDVAELRQNVTGPVLEPGAEGYATECATYNLNCVLKPAVVVGAANAEDVVAAVRFARRFELPVAVKSSAHQMVSSAEGWLLITTQRMKGISVNAEERTVRAEAGVRWSEVLPRAGEHGLAPVSGSAPEVGVIGYTLGGGQSPLLGRTHGYAADQVTLLDVVTADGELRRITPEGDPDLYWALLGGKGNFGVVTAIEFEVFPVTRFYGGGIYFRGNDLDRVLTAWRMWLPTVGDDMTSSIAVQRLPDLPALPEPLRGEFVVHLRIGYLGTATAGEKLLVPLRQAAPALLDLVGEKPVTSIGDIHLDPVGPMPYFDRCVCLTDFSEETAQALVELTGAKSNCTLTTVEIRALGGALDCEPQFPNSVPSRGLPYVVFAFAVGTLDRAEELETDLARVVDGLAPWVAERNMVNFLSPSEATDTDGVRAVYGKERYDRLAAVKRHHDPNNVFRHNHNIAPS